MNARRVVDVLILAAGLTALIVRAVADGLEQIERSLSTYTVETPSVVPLWMDEEADL